MARTSLAGKLGGQSAEYAIGAQSRHASPPSAGPHAGRGSSVDAHAGP